MIVPVLAVLLVLAVVAAAAWLLHRRVIDEGTKEEHLRADETGTVVYDVPPGQDPALLVTALEQRGYAAAADVTGGPQVLRVGAATARFDREEVRRVIAQTRTTSIEGGPDPLGGGEVRFHDERQR